MSSRATASRLESFVKVRPEHSGFGDGSLRLIASDLRLSVCV